MQVGSVLRVARPTDHLAAKAQKAPGAAFQQQCIFDAGKGLATQGQQYNLGHAGHERHWDTVLVLCLKYSKN
jgi:hypothetical protein